MIQKPQSCFRIKQMQVLSPSLTLKMPRLAPISGLMLQLKKEVGTPGTGHCAQLNILVDSILTNIWLSRQDGQLWKMCFFSSFLSL